VRGFDRIEGHFEAINKGRHISFEHVVQPRPHPLVPSLEMGHNCDICSATPTSYTCSYGDCPARMWVCHRCYGEGVTLHPWRITRQKEWALTVLRNWFEKADMARMGQLDFLQFLFFSFEVASLLVVSPAHTCLLAIRSALGEVQDPVTGEVAEAGARAVVKRWLGAVPPHMDAIFQHMARGPAGTISAHNFLKLLYSVVCTRSKYLSQSVLKLKRLKPRVCTVNRNERAIIPAVPPPPQPGVPEIQKVRLLGKGGQGMVWEVLWRGMEAAAKIPHPHISRVTLDQVVRATELQSRIRHPNVLRVYDIIRTGAAPVLVLELARGGDVDDLYACEIARPLQWRLAREVADAVNALHTSTPPIAHRDLKGANVLLSKDLHAKLADFDMALPVPVPVAGGLYGTPGFMAPEVMRTDSFYDHRVDIFSYASLLYEITHNNFPFCKEVDQSLSADLWYRAVMEITLQGLRPQLNLNACPPPMRQLITDCWASDPNQRPSMAQVIGRLDAMQHLYE
jgi:predicted Ser/Thr protein kinase